MPRAVSTEQLETTGKREHIVVLDGLRGMAIILVLMVHSIPQVSGDGLGFTALNSTVHCGVFGVDLFFVLSGFLITGVLVDSKGSQRYFRTFYIRRFLRLFPVYYGFLLTMMFLLPAFDRVAHLHLPHYEGSWWWYLLYFSNWKTDHDLDPSLGHFWSLALEEQFYLFWPVTVYLLSRRALVWWCGFLVVCAVTLRLMLVLTVDIYARTPYRLDSLAIGALFALAIRDQLWRDRLLRSSRILGPAALLVFLLSVLQNWRYPWNPLSAFFAAVWFGILVFQGAADDFGPFYSRLLRRPLLVRYGRYSYCIYVIQLVFLDQGLRLSHSIRLRFLHFSGVVATAMIMVAANVIIYWIARASWRYYEKPILGLKNRFAPVSSRPDLTRAPVLAR